MDVIDRPETFLKTKNLEWTLNHVGEPWTFGIKPEELSEYLKIRGLQLINDIGSVEYRLRHMNRSGNHLKGYEFYRAALCIVN
jgi:O-methyltransferase involved in polyketide biosynthesis